MFDTIQLLHAAPYPCPAGFERTGKRRVFNPPQVKGRSLPRLTYSTSRTGISFLIAEVSLPKMLYGTNVELISEDVLPSALDTISDHVSSVTGENFDARTARVGRLDVCDNFEVGEEYVHAYLHALHNAHYPRMVRNVFESGSVNFKNSTETVTVYSKLTEVSARALKRRATVAEVRAAVGILRVEHRYQTSSRVRRLAERLCLPERTAESLLRADIWETVMEETLSKLGLDKHIESGDARINLLRERFGVGPTYQHLAGFVTLLDNHGAEGLLSLGYNKETFRKNRQRLEEAGAWLTTPTSATLPPLQLVRDSRDSGTASSANG